MLIRRATNNDITAIWGIWMQDHVIKYMSFEKMSLSDFQSLFQHFMETSHVYVVTNSTADGKGTVIAVFRLMFGENNRTHVVEVCSLGLHKDYLNKRYGYKIHVQVIDLIKQIPHIKRIELTQSEGNKVAFKLIEKFGFEVDAVFPGWLHEKLYERYVALILDKDILDNIANADLDFETCNKIHVYSRHPIPIKYTLIPSSIVLKHIAFLTITLDRSIDLNHAADFMQDLAKQLVQQGFKKIEIFTHEPRIVKLLEMLGYHYRGKKIASLKIGDQYYNEIGVDLAIK
jgi:RimJ/RimL family protein N-acetyltransferase